MDPLDYLRLRRSKTVYPSVDPLSKNSGDAYEHMLSISDASLDGVSGGKLPRKIKILKI